MRKTVELFFYTVVCLFLLCIIGCKPLTELADYDTEVCIYIGGNNARSVEMPPLNAFEISVRLKDSAGLISEKEISPAGSTAQENALIRFTAVALGKAEITITISSSTGIWVSTIEHTVVEGKNDISIPIGKQAREFPLLFPERDNFGTSTNTVSLYSRYVDRDGNFDQKVKILSSVNNLGDAQQYTADGYGRIYYIDNGTIKRIRAGGSDDKKFSVSGVTAAKRLYYDTTKDSLYFLDNTQLKYIRFGKEFKDDGVNVISITGTSISNDAVIAALGDTVFVASRNEITSYKVKNDTVTNSKTNRNISNYHNDFQELTDIIVTGDTLYILVAKYDSGTPLCQGALFAFKKEFDESSQLAVHGFNVPALNNFYNPIKFLGISNGSLYIADDGFTFSPATPTQQPKILENKNRIGVFNTKNKTLHFIDCTSATATKDIEWLNKAAITSGSSGGHTGGSSEGSAASKQIIIWEKSNKLDAFDFYAVNPDKPASSDKQVLHASTDNQKATDVFCFDNGGNFYLVVKHGRQKFVYRWKLNGSTYEGTPKKREINIKDTEAIKDIFLYESAGEKYFYYLLGTKSLSKVFKDTNSWANNFAGNNHNTEKLAFESGYNFNAQSLAVANGSLYLVAGGTQVIKIYRYTKTPAGKYNARTIQLTKVCKAGNPIEATDIKIIENNVYLAVSIIKDSFTDAENIYGRMYKVKDEKLSDPSISTLDTQDTAADGLTVIRSGSHEATAPEQVFAPAKFIGFDEPQKFAVVSDGFFVNDGTISQRNEILIFNTADDSIVQLANSVNCSEFSRKLKDDIDNPGKYIWE